MIDQSACNKDFSCIGGFCPSFVTVEGGHLRKPAVLADSAAQFAVLPEPDLPRVDRPWNMLVAGVGGTGVLTVTSLVAMAAHIEGKGCATMNQTGLAQKFDAVLSHVRVSGEQDAINAVRIAAGEADLVLGCDLVVSSGFEALAKMARGRTRALVNCAEVPTADFIRDPDAKFPGTAMMDAIAQAVGEACAQFIDSTKIAVQLMGDSIAGNLFLLGVAWQRGLIPLAAGSLEKAIDLNNVAPEFNKQAFLWGRRFANEPQKVLQQLKQSDDPPTPETLDQIIADRVSRLEQYQSPAYAERYRRRIELLRHSDPHATAGHSLTHEAAMNLYKLMAYKDEFEVARLYSNGDFERRLRDAFAGEFKVRYHLAPPLISKRDRNTGRPRKREFGAWMLPVFTLLAAGRRLRGSWFDPFGYSAERRQERQDIDYYCDLLDLLAANTNAENYSIALKLAALPAGLRGFGHVKETNRLRLAKEQVSLLNAFRGLPEHA